MFCSECGTQVSDEFNFCSSCGAKNNSSTNATLNNTFPIQASVTKPSQEQEHQSQLLNKGRSMSESELLLIVESRKKSGVIAALLNLFLPGAGYIYCGNWILGIIAFLFVILCLIASIGLAIFALILMMVIDGFLCADRYNKKLVENIIKNRANFDTL